MWEKSASNQIFTIGIQGYAGFSSWIQTIRRVNVPGQPLPFFVPLPPLLLLTFPLLFQPHSSFQLSSCFIFVRGATHLLSAHPLSVPSSSTRKSFKCLPPCLNCVRSTAHKNMYAVSRFYAPLFLFLHRFVFASPVTLNSSAMRMSYCYCCH